MLGRRLFIGVSAIAILFGTVLGPFLGLSVTADMNGDHSVDVLDAQTLVANAMVPRSTAEDVNGDGTVDVLDLQRLLGDTESAKLPEQEEESATPDMATFPCPMPGPMPALARTAAFSSTVVDRTASRAAVLHWDDAVSPAVHTRPFLRELSPHAPPAIT